MKFRFLLFLITGFFVGCSQPGEDFIGRWSNEYSGGKMAYLVARDGDHFLVKEILTEDNRTIGIYSAQVQDKYLVVEGSEFLKKIYYSETEDALLIDPQIPLFRRTQK